MPRARRRVAAVKRMSNRRLQRGRPLPRLLRPLFWDFEPGRVRWDRDWPFVAQRVLSSGGRRELRWLRQRLRADQIRDLTLRSEGRGLSPPRIRFYELVVDLPEARADAWVEEARRQPWFRRQRR